MSNPISDMSLLSASNVYLLIGYAEATNSNVQYNTYLFLIRFPFTSVRTSDMSKQERPASNLKSNTPQASVFGI